MKVRIYSRSVFLAMRLERVSTYDNAKKEEFAGRKYGLRFPFEVDGTGGKGMPTASSTPVGTDVAEGIGSRYDSH